MKHSDFVKSFFSDKFNPVAGEIVRRPISNTLVVSKPLMSTPTLVLVDTARSVIDTEEMLRLIRFVSPDLILLASSSSSSVVRLHANITAENEPC